MRAVRNGALLLRNDLRALLRSPMLSAILIIYPLVVGVLVIAVFQEGDRAARLAVVNLDDAGRTVQVGTERLSVDDYIQRLGDTADMRMLDASAAAEALADGRVDAVITIPDGFVSDLQSGLRSPKIRVDLNDRSPVAADAMRRRIDASVYRLNQRLAEGYMRQVVALVDVVVNGGEFGLFNRGGGALGLTQSRAELADLQHDLRAGGNASAADRLGPLLGFIDLTRANLDLAVPAAEAIRSPIEVNYPKQPAGRSALNGFGAASALLVSLTLIGLMLGAAGIGWERADGVLQRLTRGLVRPTVLIGEKIGLSALLCGAVGAVLLGALALTDAVTVDRWALWFVVLVLSGGAFGALGALVGALTRDTRAALPAAFMLGVPLIAVALLPADAPQTIAAWTPLGPSFALMTALLTEPSLSVATITADIVRLLVMVAVAAGAAGALLARQTRV